MARRASNRRCAAAGCTSGTGAEFRYTLTGRFRNDPEWKDHAYGDGRRANLAVFGAQRRYPSGELAPDEIFPSALRITVDVYDDADRLERPVRHVMVIPVGF